MNIQEIVFTMRDEKYREFQAKLIPGIPPETIIGIRTPALRSFAKRLLKEGDVSGFLEALPHRYFDENQLHAFLLSEIKDFDTALAGVEQFLPYVDNWATCDQLSPKVFRKHREELLGAVRNWTRSDRTYTVRFGIRMLMQHYLDDRFEPDYLEWVAAVQSEAYYVNMMRAWYFATALAKQYDAAVRIMEARRLDAWTHNKTIQKARESFRVSAAHKAYLHTLKRG